ncbi:MAG: aminopeptidase P family protein [Candidatus Eisenbacteria bacterium]|uniref:Xaa-Pro aminopeptidase n=1 Tax=Eiseniibacteriota bacterium TaxID=2212470 RepID=A0A538T9D6_UNCEI|nr:MAG: aminopeptidase P family protein [Candidatus Eisenbacteria bacterium]
MLDYLARRRERVRSAWALTDEIVLVGAGEPISIPGGADQTYPFASHAEFFWLTDVECPGGVIAFDPLSGWTDFAPAVTESERVWEGKRDTPGTPLPELAGWLAARRGRECVTLGVPLPGMPPAAPRAAELRAALDHARRPKDAVELERMRRAAAATAAGFAVAERLIRPGVSEREIQIELEAEFFRRGGDGAAYGTIVGAGSNSGVLHFKPTARTIGNGDVVLIDAGAEVRRYASDVTRTWQAPGGDPGLFRDLYRVVLEVEERAVRRCKPGTEWRDVHLQAALELTAGLVELDILRGEPAALVERDAHALFFPHGIGHLVGLGVRDASGYLPGRVRSDRPGLKNLRTDLPLEPGYVITVEPGLYFIPPLLNDAARRAQHRDAVNWSRVDKLLEFGGIRIEDDVHVTDGPPEVLTAAVPKALPESSIAA